MDSGDELAGSVQSPGLPLGPQPRLLAGCRVLVIEDDFLIGLGLLEMLEDEGAAVLGPIGSVEQALLFIAEQSASFDQVILDLNLHGIKSYPIADALVRGGIPFVFASGYSSDAIEAAYRGYPHCVKPVTSAALLAAFAPTSRIAADGQNYSNSGQTGNSLAGKVARENEG